MTELKIAEIHADQNPWLACPQLPGKRHTLDPQWFREQLTHTQQQFLKNTSAHLRPHPRQSKSHVIEVLIDRHTVSERILTLAALLFH